MFVIKKTNSYTWPVKCESAVNGGKFEKETFEVEFKRIPDSEVKKALGLVPVEERKQKMDKEFCKEIVLGWKDVKDESGEDVPFSQTALDTLLEFPGVARSIVEAFLESIAGSKVKN